MRRLLLCLALGCSSPAPPAPECPEPEPQTCPEPAWVPPPPLAAAKHDTTPLLERYVGEQDGDDPVRYFGPVEREAARVLVRDGKLVSRAGAPLDAKEALFVMDAAGNFYATPGLELGRVHHSSLLAGAPVAAAGTLDVATGTLLLVTNHSGHYRPDEGTLDAAIGALRAAGADLSKAKRQAFGGDPAPIPPAR